MTVWSADTNTYVKREDRFMFDKLEDFTFIIMKELIEYIERAGCGKRSEPLS